MKKKVPDYFAWEQELEAPKPVKAIEQVAQHYQNDGKPDAIGQVLWLRMLYSCLVDGDFLDTEAYMQRGAVKRGGFASLEQLHERFFSALKEKGFFHPQNDLNRKRCEILRWCIQMGKNKENRIYTLTVPTGGGKTLSVFAWALEKAKICGKCHIIYVISYTSIIEQTADILRSYLGEENVIEHHSQVEYEDTDEKMDTRRLATENWDAPVLVTTNVQFFASLFANRSSRCRKLYNMANSVLLFDVVQMFPVNYMTPVLRSLEALVRHFSCSALLYS
ncbi:DEAD/DEAH box helicase [Acidaminococcus sp. LBK-2]|uniref:CRISPR-associated helicase/endonuclease Cas3 n=1 Tax=Acidaminococcus sp. LBK-2 TaxID=3456956 RepID=UPI003FA4A318